MSGPTFGDQPDSKQRVSSISRRRNARGLVLTLWERPRFETLGKSVTASRSHHHTVCTGGDWLHRGHYTTDPSSWDEIPLQTRQGIS